MAYRDRMFAEETDSSNSGKHYKYSAPYEKKRIKLALAGGGAYGAYTTGVVIQLLLDPRIEIVEISGTSAGEKIALIVGDKINGAHSYDEGRQEAVHGLFDFWSRAVRESATVMHALDVIEAPWNPDAWLRFFMTAASIHSRAVAQPTVFDMWRDMFSGLPLVQHFIDTLETPWKTLESHVFFGNDVLRRGNANLPCIDDMMNGHQRLSETFDSATHSVPFFAVMPQGFDLAMGTLQSASTAVATDALRGLIGRVITSEPDPRDPDDHIFTHAASSKFIKIHINTSVERSDGSMSPCLHSGRNLTLKRSMGSSALKGFLSPSVIDGKRHWDGGYTENPCLSVLAESNIPCDGIIIIGANRPATLNITPRLQRAITPKELEGTMGLVMHQMYDEAVWRAQHWKKGQPTWHLITHNHPPENDWTATQNTFDWHIRSLIHLGQSDGVAALAGIRPYIGVEPTISKEELENIAREGLRSSGARVHINAPLPWAKALRLKPQAA